MKIVNYLYCYAVKLFQKPCGQWGQNFEWGQNLALLIKIQEHFFLSRKGQITLEISLVPEKAQSSSLKNDKLQLRFASNFDTGVESN